MQRTLEVQVAEGGVQLGVQGLPRGGVGGPADISAVDVGAYNELLQVGPRQQLAEEAAGIAHPALRYDGLISYKSVTCKVSNRLTTLPVLLSPLYAMTA